MKNRVLAVAALTIAFAHASLPQSPTADPSEKAGSIPAPRAQLIRSDVDTARSDGTLKGTDTPSSINAKDANSESEDSSLTTIYRIGVGDVLDIRVRNFASGASTLFTVTEGGTIDYPILGAPFQAVGQTTDELQRHLVLEFKRRALLESPQVSVMVRQYTSHTVMITGLVASGGTKLLRREAVPLYVILAEAQSRLEAARANIMRANQPVITVDLTDPTSLGVLVRPGDIIAITARPELYYYIAGRINNPGQK